MQEVGYRTYHWSVLIVSSCTISLTHKIFAASDMLVQAERLSGPYTNATAVSLDMSDEAQVGNFITGCDVVIRFVTLFGRFHADSMI